MKKILVLSLALALLATGSVAQAFSFSDLFSIFSPQDNQAAVSSSLNDLTSLNTGPVLIPLPKGGLDTGDTLPTGNGSCASVPLPVGQNLQTVVCLNGAWRATSALQINGVNYGDSVKTAQLCLGADCRNAWPSGSTGGGSGVGGSGTTNYLSKWINATTLGNSQLFDNGQGVGIGVTNPVAKLDVNGQVSIRGGQPGNGKVLTSDANGLASWKVPTATGGGSDNLWQLESSDGILNSGDRTVNIRKSGTGNALYVDGTNGFAIHAISHQVANGEAESGAITGSALGNGSGVKGTSRSGNGVYGVVDNGTAVAAHVNGIGGSPGYGFYQTTGGVLTKNYFQSPLGIGTQNPASALDVTGTGSGREIRINGADGDPTLRFQDSGATPKSYLLQLVGSQGAETDRLRVWDVNNNSERLTIATNGNVGIGTPTPTERLDLGGGNIKMGYEVITDIAQNSGAAAANCPIGKRVVGGGCNSAPTGQLTGSFPVGEFGWQCYSTANATITAYAICANIR